MNTLTSPPLVFLHLLADRKGAPSALLIEVDTPDALPPLLEHADFGRLSAKFVCLAGAGAPAACIELLISAGCRKLTEDEIHRADHQFTQHLAPSVQWLSGDWYLAPPAKPQGAQAASRAMALQLVQLVAADADTHEIEAVLRRDPALSYHLLRLVNSLAMGLGRRITSFSQAILILGRQQLRRWLNLMLFAARDGDPRSPMLMARVALRARMMEVLAKAGGLDKPAQEQAFMAGLFSMLGILFGMPLEQVLQPLMISEALRSALLAHEGELGGLLGLIESVERADGAAVAAALETRQIAPHEFNLLAFQSCNWMLDIVNDSQGGHA